MSTESDKVNTGALATIIVAGAMFVAGVAAGVTALVRHEVNLVGDEVGANADLQPVQKLKADQKSELSASPAWEDKSEGTVDIPIDRAMKLVVAEISRNPEAATPPASAAPAPAPAPESADAGATKDVPEKGSKPAGQKPKPAAPPTHKPAPVPAPAPQPAPGGNAP